SEALPNLVDMGLQIPMWWAHEKTGIPKPQDNEPVLQRMAMPAAALKQQPSIAVLRQQPLPPMAPDAGDALTGQLQEATVDHLRTWIDAIRDMAASAASLEQLRDRLLNAYGDLPGEELTEVMALALTVASARGIRDVATEAGQLPAQEGCYGRSVSGAAGGPADPPE